VIDINRLLQRLCDADIDFVIVGGFAATLHGSSLVTRDLDVCATLSSENVASIEVELFERTCRVMSLDDLILAKEALGREKDLLAAKELRAVREKQKP
jgi:molybdopterin-guanine dinucleotide biosynthesis protein